MTRSKGKYFATLASAFCIGMLLQGATATAGDGHDHGDAPASAVAPALPRLSATSELFEMVGVLEGSRLTLFLDRADDNSPVLDARLQLEVDGKEIPVTSEGDGVYIAQLAAAPAPGVIPVTATLTAGSESDLLAGELDIHEDAHAHPAAAASSWPKLRSLTSMQIAAAIALLTLLAATWWIATGVERSRAEVRDARRNARQGVSS